MRPCSTERGEEDKLWGSHDQAGAQAAASRASTRAYYGFRSFSRLLEEARDRKLLELELDEKSGSYIIKTVLTKNRVFTGLLRLGCQHAQGLSAASDVAYIPIGGAQADIIPVLFPAPRKWDLERC